MLIRVKIKALRLVRMTDKAQYTPPTPTRLNCRVASRRRCVQKSQLAHDDCRRVRSHCRHDATRLRCRQICSDPSRLSPTSCEFRTHRRRDSTRQLSRVGVGGVYWALHSSIDVAPPIESGVYGWGYSKWRRPRRRQSGSAGRNVGSWRRYRPDRRCGKVRNPGTACLRDTRGRTTVPTRTCSQAPGCPSYEPCSWTSVTAALYGHIKYYIFPIYTVSQKNCANFFLSELFQMSTDCKNFWHKDSKEDKLFCGVLIFHRT